MLRTARINVDTMRSAAAKGYLNATDLADYLVKKGTAFRDAHSIVGKVVAHCIEKKIEIDKLSLDELRQFSSIIENDVYENISLENCVNRRKTIGGPAEEAVMESICQGLGFINKLKGEIAAISI